MEQSDHGSIVKNEIRPGGSKSAKSLGHRR